MITFWPTRNNCVKNMNQFLNFISKKTKQVWVQIKANTGDFGVYLDWFGWNKYTNLLKIFVHYTDTGCNYFIMSLTNKFSIV